MTTTVVTDVSTAFQSALSSDYALATLAEIWSSGTLVQTLSVDPGSTVTVDRTAAIRRHCALTLTDIDGTLTPTGASDLLTPYGNEVRLYRGITYPNGNQELVRLGVFGIEESDVDDRQNDLVLTVTGMDRARSIQRTTFTDTYSVAPAQNLSAAIQALLNSLSLGFSLTYAVTPTSAVTPGSPTVCKAGDDPWKAATDLAKAAGYELWFDVSGVCTMQPVQDPITSPVTWAYDEGPNNITIALKRKLTRATAANYVIRDGQSSGHAAPVRGVAADVNPASQTYIGGSYGTVVDYKASALYANQAQAQAAASADLLLNLGSVESLSISAIPKPDHDAGDVIEVTRARSKLSSAYYVLDSFTMGMDPSALLQAQARRVTR